MILSHITSCEFPFFVDELVNGYNMRIRTILSDKNKIIFVINAFKKSETTMQLLQSLQSYYFHSFVNCGNLIPKKDTLVQCDNWVDIYVFSAIAEI